MDDTRGVPKSSQIAVFFFAGIVILSETILFHATRFVLDYMLAMTVIGCAVAGIGLGSFLASRLRCREVDVFGWCCGGTAICLYLAAFVLLRQPNLFLLLPAVASVFVFPSAFIARTFARHAAPGVYFFDMLGAGTAVGVTVFAYEHASSQTIFLGLVTVLPLAGAIWTGLAPSRTLGPRLSTCLWLLLLTSVGSALLYQQVRTDALNIVQLVNPNAANIPAQSVLRRPSRFSIRQSYDSLIGRIDTIPVQDGKLPAGRRTYVTYDGFFNDNFRDTQPHDYLEYAKPHKLRFPVADRRVVYGLVSEPRVFIIGAAATGIIKTIRKITPLDRIDAVEVNPGILQMMQQDFFEESGRAYEGLHVVQGNALSNLRRSKSKYDIITLINTHSSRWIGALGAPDYLHTRESYDLYLDRLTDDGYLLFEERPDTRRGEWAVKRMILTLYDCLQRRGVEDPAAHFFIWEFMSSRYRSSEATGMQTGSDMYYIGMVVSLKPFTGQRRQDLLDWYNREWMVAWDKQKQPVHYPQPSPMQAAYLKDEFHGERFGPFFDMIRQGDFSQLDPNFDASIVTDDRPFPSCSTTYVPEVARLVRVTSGLSFLLGVLFTLSAVGGVRRKGRVGLLIVYNLAVGSAYFFVEIMLIQAYQSIFLSPSTSLVLVLGLLLIGSGVGGLLSPRISVQVATALLLPALLVSLWVPGWILSLGLETATSSTLAATVVFLVGVNMGVYFPKGLLVARGWSLRSKIPHLFAINSIAGSLAVVLSFYLGIRVGYTWTIVLAYALYVLGSAVYVRAAGKPSI